MMGTRLFLKKAISKIERIDKEALSKLVLELTQEKKFLEDLLDQISLGIIVLDSKLNVKLINQLGRALTGVAGNVSVTPLTLAQVITDSDLFPAIKRAVDRQNDVFDEPFECYSPRHIRGNWNLRKFSAVGTGALVDTAPLFAFWIQPESGKEEKLKEKHHAERLMSILTLASGIAHELGNPLNSIAVHLHLLNSDIDKLPESYRDKLKKSVEIVTEEAERLDKIVRNFLKSTRRKPLFFQLSDIHHVINQTLTLLEPELKESAVKIKTDFDSELPEFFMDNERLSRVFINLIKNSIQAMPSGGTVKITTSRKKNSCVITIADTGVGITREELPKIFDAYYTTKEEGSGLGLVISYQIIREHSGKIDVQSKPGKGTTISITLPIRKEKLQLPAPKYTQSTHDNFI